MTSITEHIGHKIRYYRRKNGQTLATLAQAICKSKATLSKYENGTITVDLQTLYDLANCLHVRVEQLLYHQPRPLPAISSRQEPTFFSGISHFYSYLFDGRTDALIRCRFDLLPAIENQRERIFMYMNFSP